MQRSGTWFFQITLSGLVIIQGGTLGFSLDIRSFERKIHTYVAADCKNLNLQKIYQVDKMTSDPCVRTAWRLMENGALCANPPNSECDPTWIWSSKISTLQFKRVKITVICHHAHFSSACARQVSVWMFILKNLGFDASSLPFCPQNPPRQFLVVSCF